MSKAACLLILLYGMVLPIPSASAQEFVWGRQVGGTGGNVVAWSATVDAAGNTYVSGTFEGTVDFDPGSTAYPLTSSGPDAFVLKLDSSGAFVWAEQFSGPSFEHALAIAVDAAGSVYVGGWFYDTVDFDPGVGTLPLTSGGSSDAFVLKLDSTGTLIWARQLEGTGVAEIFGVAVTAGGEVYSAGFFDVGADFDPGMGVFNVAATGSADAFVWKLDSAGNFLWAYHAAGLATDVAYDVSVASNGDVAAAGWFGGTADFNPGGVPINLTSMNGTADPFVIKLSPTGNVVWVKQIRADDGYAWKVAIDASGLIYSIGSYSGLADLDPGPLTFSVTSNAGSLDGFFQVLDAAGDFVRGISVGGPGSDGISAIQVDNSGNTYLAGGFEDTVDFDPGAGVSSLTAPSGTSDGFLLRLDSVGGFSWVDWFTGGVGSVENLGLRGDQDTYAIGRFSALADFDPGPKLFNMSPIGTVDGFILRLAPIALTCHQATCPGRHWIALPTTSQLKTAEHLCSTVPNALTVSQVFPDGTGRYTWECTGASPACTDGNGPKAPETGTCGSACFCVDDGEGYEVVTTGPVGFPVYGSDDAVTITLPAGGTNYLVSPPLHSTAANASDFLNQLTDAPGTVRLVGLDPCTQTTQSYLKGDVGPFSLVVGRAYMVLRNDTAGTSYPSPVDLTAPPFPPCAGLQGGDHCIFGVSGNVPYSWGLDENTTGVIDGADPTAVAPGVNPAGAPASDLAFQLAQSIDALANYSATAYGNCLSITPAVDLFVGGSVPTCKVSVAGCPYNPVAYRGVGPDCDTANAAVWSPPGETLDLTFCDAQTLSWKSPVDPGAMNLGYDLLRSASPISFLENTICVESNDTVDQIATDATIPNPGGALYYLVSARNACPGVHGRGPLGFRSNGRAREGQGCP